MIWYPYEQLKTMKAPYEIVDANGVYLYTKDQRLIDSVSSWWSVIHGYKHPVINQAIISQVEKFSHVMHITSRVTGRLRADKDCLDALQSVFPAGTLSGAPKIRACQIIDELEPQRRGIYGGGMGYIDFGGNMDICITIRTMVKRAGKVYIQAGGGIVADSVIDNEFAETVNKAGACMKALRETAKE